MKSTAARIAFVVLAASIVACQPPASRTELEQKQGVEGIVRYKPDYDHSDLALGRNPPDLTPRPLAGATVFLIAYLQQEVPSVNSNNILDAVSSDSLGGYRLLAAPGRYFVAIGKSPIPTVVHRYDLSDSVGLNFPISAVTLVDIPAGQIISHDFEIAELVAQ